MNTNSALTRLLAAAWLLAAVAAASGAKARSAYLPTTGPTPLRFEVALVKPAAPALAAAEPSPAEKPEEITPAVAGPSPANPPADIHYSAGEAVPPTDAPAESESAYPSPSHPLAEHPLIVTPQMLAEYFKPVGGTNAPGVSVVLPVPVSFTPPTDQPQPRSRATYKTE